MGPAYGTHLTTELPPRARRIPVDPGGVTGIAGTTSACAENTHKNALIGIAPGNYLRVRGEYPK